MTTECECVVCKAKFEVLRDLRDMWAYEGAHGTPVMSVKLTNWVKYCREVGVPNDWGWWELEHEDYKEYQEALNDNRC